MPSIKEIAWIAGLLEGEGCFYNNSKRYCSPIIQLTMTDKDVIIKAAKIMKAHKAIEQKTKTKAGKTIYTFYIFGNRAIQWMMTLYIMMGERRRKKITELIDKFKNSPKSPYPERKSYSRGAKIIWSREEGYLYSV